MVAQNFTAAGTAAVAKALAKLLNVCNKPAERKEIKQGELENIITLLSDTGRIYYQILYILCQKIEGFYYYFILNQL